MSSVLVLAQHIPNPGDDGGGGPGPGGPDPQTPSFLSIAFPFSLNSVKGVFWNAGTASLGVIVVIAVGWVLFERFLKKLGRVTKS